MSVLSQLEGAKLNECINDGENFVFNFDTGTLAAYNPVALSNKDALVGSKVQSVNFIESQSLEIKFNNNCSILVSLAPDEYVGPEAFCMQFNNGVIVVE